MSGLSSVHILPISTSVPFLAATLKTTLWTCLDGLQKKTPQCLSVEGYLVLPGAACFLAAAILANVVSQSVLNCSARYSRQRVRDQRQNNGSADLR